MHPSIPVEVDSVGQSIRRACRSHSADDDDRRLVVREAHGRERVRRESIIRTERERRIRLVQLGQSARSTRVRSTYREDEDLVGHLRSRPLDLTTNHIHRLLRRDVHRLMTPSCTRIHRKGEREGGDERRSQHCELDFGSRTIVGADQQLKISKG